MWYYTVVGQSRCPVVDTWWQTETGSHMIAPMPGAVPLKPGSCTLPLPASWPPSWMKPGTMYPTARVDSLSSSARSPPRHAHCGATRNASRNTYFPKELGGKYYLAGDSANRDLDGYFWIMGRIDDVLNVSGHRLGTMEIESALVASPLVAEAAVVGKPDEIKGEAIVAFVVLKGARPEGEMRSQYRIELRNWVSRKSVRLPGLMRSASATTCRKPVPAKSCAACCAPSPRARK